mmetsp:Transcript_48304/g.115079  ORF Transcript_48304/g.115079 Transcript_48304/m.115079 type:complete len:532 (+) Transcript_48304:905-2500(+)
MTTSSTSSLRSASSFLLFISSMHSPFSSSVVADSMQALNSSPMASTAASSLARFFLASLRASGMSLKSSSLTFSVPPMFCMQAVKLALASSFRHTFMSSLSRSLAMSCLMRLSSESSESFFRAALNTSSTSSQVALLSASLASAHALAASLAAPLAPSMLRRSTAMSVISSGLMPMDWAAFSFSNRMHTSLDSAQSLPCSLAALRPASISASSVLPLGPSPPPTLTAASARMSLHCFRASSSSAASMHASICSPSFFCIALCRTFLSIWSLMSVAVLPMAVPKVSLAAATHCVFSSSGQLSISDHRSSRAPSSRNSLTSESFTLSLSLPKLSATEPFNESVFMQPRLASFVDAVFIHTCISWAMSLAAPWRMASFRSPSLNSLGSMPLILAAALFASMLVKQASFSASVLATVMHSLTTIRMRSSAAFLSMASNSSLVTLVPFRSFSDARALSLHSWKPLAFTMPVEFNSSVQFFNSSAKAKATPRSASSRCLGLSGASPSLSSSADRHSSRVFPASKHAANCSLTSRGGR